MLRSKLLAVVLTLGLILTIGSLLVYADNGATTWGSIKAGSKVKVAPKGPRIKGKSRIVVPDDYDTIQEAINSASDGDTILVSEGTYKECLLIDGVDLRLVAVGDVTIEAPMGTITPGKTGCEPHGDTIQIYNSTTTIDGFKVVGGKGGIYARGMSEYGETEVDVTIQNNTVIEYGKNGITVNGDMARAKILNNSVVGRGELPLGDYAQNGIQIGFQAKGIVRNNTVSDNWYIGGYWTATNILLFATTGVQALNNILKDGQTGIAVSADLWWGYGGGTNNKVISNSVEGKHYGPYDSSSYGSWAISIFGDNNKVVNNTIGSYDVGVETLGTNNKVIHNTFNDCVETILDSGEETKIHANARR